MVDDDDDDDDDEDELKNDELIITISIILIIIYCIHNLILPIKLYISISFLPYPTRAPFQKKHTQTPQGAFFSFGLLLQVFLSQLQTFIHPKPWQEKPWSVARCWVGNIFVATSRDHEDLPWEQMWKPYTAG